MSPGPSGEDFAGGIPVVVKLMFGTQIKEPGFAWVPLPRTLILVGGRQVMTASLFHLARQVVKFGCVLSADQILKLASRRIKLAGLFISEGEIAQTVPYCQKAQRARPDSVHSNGATCWLTL